MGILFVVLGSLVFILGVISMASDIQVGIAVGGLNLIGIGLVLMKLGKKTEEVQNSN